MKKVAFVAVLLAACTCASVGVLAKNDRVLTNDGGSPPPLCNPFQNPNCTLPPAQ